MVDELINLITERIEYCNQRALKLVKGGGSFYEGGVIDGERAAIENERQYWFKKLLEFRSRNKALG